MTKDEALKLALEALEVLLKEPIAHKAADKAEYLLLQAAPAIREALTDSALDRMAENARELGLDYEPIVEQVEDSVGMGHGAWDMVEPKDLAKAFHEALAEQTAQQQEPVAVMTVLHLKDRTEIGYGPASAGYNLPTGEYKLYTSPQPAQQPRYDLLHEYAITNRLDYNGLCRVVRAATERPVQQQKPVAWADLNALTEQFNSVNCGTAYRLPGESRQPLYTSPPASKPWVGLTDEEIRNWWRIENGLEDCNMAKLVDFTLAVRAIEAKLREKNA